MVAANVNNTATVRFSATACPASPNNVVLGDATVLGGTFDSTIVIGIGAPAFDPGIHVQLNAAGIDVAWTTREEADGYVEWGMDGTFPNTANDVRGVLSGRLNKKTHKVSISGVGGGSTINYRIVSGGSVFTQTPVTIPSHPLVAAVALLLGSVSYEDGSAGRECNVFMRVSQLTFGTPLYSLYVNAQTDGGSYTLDVTNIRQNPANDLGGQLGSFNNDFNKTFTYDASSQDATIEVTAACDSLRSGSTSVKTADVTVVGGNYLNVNIVVLEPPTFFVDSVTVNEGDGTATTILRLNPVADVETSIEWRTEDGTAKSTEDYTAQASTTETFIAGQATTSISVPITDDALDEADESLTIIIGNATGGALVGSGGTIRITDNDAAPTLSVPTTASVTEGNTGTTPVNITVNVSPVSGADIIVSYNTSDGTATSADSDFVTASTLIIPAGEASGTATVNVNGDTKFEGDENFTVTFAATSHGENLTVNPNVTTVTIVNNDAPTANDDGTNEIGTTDEDTVLTSTQSVLVNDSAPAAGANLTAVVVDPISEGVLNLSPDGTFTFDPRGAFDDLKPAESRNATFTYKAVDSRATTPDSAPATVTIKVDGNTNDAPEVADTVDNVTVDEDSAPTILLGSVFTDPDGDTLTLTAQSSDPSLVDVTVETTTLKLSYGENKNGTAEITVTATDPGGLSVSTKFTVTVNPVDDPPKGVPDTTLTDEDTAVDIDVIANDNAQDVDGDTLSVTGVDNTGTKGTASLNANGTLRYDPGAVFQSLDDGESVTDTFKYVLTDGTGQDTTTVDVTVKGRNDPPTATPDAYRFFDDTLKIDAANGVLANDNDVDAADKGKLVARLVTDVPVGEGTLTLRGNGSFDFIPGNVEKTSFTYDVFDGTEVSNTVTVELKTSPSFVVEAPWTVEETAGTVTVSISLINPHADGTASTVTLGTASGAAPDGATAADIGAVGGGTTVILSKTQTSTTRTVQIINDNVREGAEDFFAVLSNPDVSSGIKFGRARIFILDPEDRPTVTVEAVLASEGQGPAKFRITLVGRTELGAKVQYKTDNTDPISARSGDEPGGTGKRDYVPIASRLVSFGPNTTADGVSQEFTVDIVDDKIDEPDERFLVRLMGASELAPQPIIFLGNLAKAEGPLSRTVLQATVTIEDNDDQPRLIVVDRRVNESVDGAVTVDVRLEGASSKGVGVAYTTGDVDPAGNKLENAATPGDDYTRSFGLLNWDKDESGIKVVTLTVIDDAIEEDSEIVLITLSAPGNAQIGRGLGFLTIDDDEPSAAVVTITSMDEAVPGDQFFLVVAASESLALGLTGIKVGGVTSNWPWPGATLMKIEDLPMILRSMHGLNWVKSKPATHVMLGTVPKDYPQGRFEFTVNMDFTIGGVDTRKATLDVKGARSNRNYFLFPNINFVGLGLVPANPSIAALLEQDAYPIEPDFEDDVTGDDQDKSVRLKDVVEKILAYKFDANGGFIEYHTDDRRTSINEQPQVQSLTQIKPYQGMIFKTRADAFKWVPVGPFGELRAVPIRMNIEGPFLDISNPLKLTQVTQPARQGWNFVASHTEDPAPFFIVFRSLLIPFPLASGSIGFEREVKAVQQSNVVAHVVERFAIATITAMIRPEFSYWLRVEASGTTLIPKASEPPLP